MFVKDRGPGDDVAQAEAAERAGIGPDPRFQRYAGFLKRRLNFDAVFGGINRDRNEAYIPALLRMTGFIYPGISDSGSSMKV